jgi:hypothetical protein
MGLSCWQQYFFISQKCSRIFSGAVPWAVSEGARPLLGEKPMDNESVLHDKYRHKGINKWQISLTRSLLAQGTMALSQPGIWRERI